MGEIMDFKRQYEEIVIPDELDLTIEKAIKMGKRQRKTSFIRPASAAALIAAVFISVVNISPAFAYYMEDVPGISFLVGLVKFDKGLKLAAENGCIQQIDKSAEDKGIKFTVDNVILDRKRIIIAYTIETKDKYKNLMPAGVKISGKNGEKIEAAVSYGAPDSSHYEKDGKLKGFFDVHYRGNEGETFPEYIILSIAIFGEEPYVEDGRIKPTGRWAVEFRLDKALTSIEPKVMDVNKEFSIGQMKFYIEHFKVYPTVIEVIIRADKENGYRFTGFKDLYLEDEKGNRYTYKGGTIPGEETVLNFESNYFIEAKKLYLSGGGIYLMPREDQYLVVDLDSRKVVEDGGYGLELLYAKENQAWGDTEYDFMAAFEVRDREILDGEMGISLDTKVYDENNNEYMVNGQFESSSEGHNQTGFMIEKMDKMPHMLKIKILSVPKGMMEPFRIRLK